MAISILKLSQQYGYDESTLRNWKRQGMPHDKDIPEEETRKWIIDNIINPLRNTDYKEQIEKAKLRTALATAELAEMEVAEAHKNVINVDYVEQVLSKYFKKQRDYLRTLGQKIYVEVFEQDSAISVKRIINQRMDEMLNEIAEFELQESKDGQQSKKVKSSTEKVSTEVETTTKNIAK
ncbi:hypothetical protein SC206_19025 [Rouxiella sp. T17]|uniref:hypothetical protein n=1 Tax=Rouxiella sp. T17 TaxID=3085684 RepID=UPI002FC97EF3